MDFSVKNIKIQIYLPDAASKNSTYHAVHAFQ
jgi:hypothetical protein